MKPVFWTRTALLGVCLVFLLPVIWLLSTSYKPASEIFGIPPRLLFSPTLEISGACSCSSTCAN